MPYTPDPTNVNAPADSEVGSTAPAEFRALKAYLAERLALKADSSTVALAAEVNTIAEVDAKDAANLQNMIDFISANYISAAAVTILVETVKETLYPVGTIYENTNEGINPESYLGFGKWSPVLGFTTKWIRTS